MASQPGGLTAEWACAACTFVNTGAGGRACEMCGGTQAEWVVTDSQRSAASSSSSSSFGGGARGHDDDDDDDLVLVDNDDGFDVHHHPHAR